MGPPEWAPPLPVRWCSVCPQSLAAAVFARSVCVYFPNTSRPAWCHPGTLRSVPAGLRVSPISEARGTAFPAAVRGPSCTRLPCAPFPWNGQRGQQEWPGHTCGPLQVAPWGGALDVQDTWPYLRKDRALGENLTKGRQGCGQLRKGWVRPSDLGSQEAPPSPCRGQQGASRQFGERINPERAMG